MLKNYKKHCKHAAGKIRFNGSHQEGTETVEAEEVEDSEVGPTGVLLPW